MNAIEHINLFHNNKGTLAPFAEKAHQNVKQVLSVGKSETMQRNALYYFAIGHAFKQINQKECFGLTTQGEATQYERLRNVSFPHGRKMENKQGQEYLVDNFSALLNGLRNASSHYVAKWGPAMRMDYNKDLREFLVQAYALSMQVAKGEPMAFTNGARMEAEKELFFTIDSDIIAYKGIDRYDFQRGEYLTVTGVLFVLTMFMYNDMSEFLLVDFEKKEEFAFSKKQFMLFSKRVSATDVDSETEYLVRYRDLMMYIGKYPNFWNSSEIEIKGDLNKQIVRMEAARIVKDYEGNFEHHYNRFIEKLNDSSKAMQEDEPNELEDMRIEFFHQNEDAMAQMQAKLPDFTAFVEAKLLSEKKKLKNDYFKTDFDLWLQGSKDAELNFEEVNRRWGRGNDRFMEYAVRFLLEQNFFGDAAKFKCYQFYYPEDNQAYLANLKVSDKKKYDQTRTRMHGGRATCYFSHEEIKEMRMTYEWEFPLVEQNNAIQVKLPIHGKERILVIQRTMLPTLLKMCLSGNNELLADYVEHNELRRAMLCAKVLQNQSLSEAETLEARQLMPSSFLQLHGVSKRNEEARVCPFQQLIDDTRASEARYEKLYAEAEKKGSVELDYFLRKDKGVSFKVRFIFKASNLMWNAQHARNKIGADGKMHTNYHFSREQFDVFSRCLRAINDSEESAEELVRLLTAKGFTELKKIVESKSRNANRKQILQNIYQEVMQQFEAWQQNYQPEDKRANTATVAKELRFMTSNQIVINLAHFRTWVKQRQLISAAVAGIDNRPYLIAPYYPQQATYGKGTLRKSKTAFAQGRGTLWQKVSNVQVEDALLYELAMRYFAQSVSGNEEQMRSMVEKLNDQQVELPVVSEGKLLYTLEVPMKHLHKVSAILKQNEEEKNKEFAFLTNIPELFRYVRRENGAQKNMKSLAEKFYESKKLNYSELFAVHKYTIQQDKRMCREVMQEENDYIYKNKTGVLPWSGDNYVKMERKDFSQDVRDARNAAFHLNLPFYSKKIGMQVEGYLFEKICSKLFMARKPKRGRR